MFALNPLSKLLNTMCTTQQPVMYAEQLILRQTNPMIARQADYEQNSMSFIAKCFDNVGKPSWGDCQCNGGHLASLGKALQPGDLEEGDDWEHNGGQGVDWQPVLLHDSNTLSIKNSLHSIMNICDDMSMSCIATQRRANVASTIMLSQKGRIMPATTRALKFT